MGGHAVFIANCLHGSAVFVVRAAWSFCAQGRPKNCQAAPEPRCQHRIYRKEDCTNECCMRCRWLAKMPWRLHASAPSGPKPTCAWWVLRRPGLGHTCVAGLGGQKGDKLWYYSFLHPSRGTEDRRGGICGRRNRGFKESRAGTVTEYCPSWHNTRHTPVDTARHNRMPPFPTATNSYCHVRSAAHSHHVHN